MESYLERLKSDHLRMRRILLQLDRDLQLSQEPDADLGEAMTQVVNALCFIAGYPEHCHHPLEDLLFRRLLEIDAPCAKSVEQLLDEHESMALQTGFLLQRFEQALQSREPPDSLLISESHAYFRIQTEHQRREADNVFPVMAAFLDSSDWRRAERTLLTTPSEASLCRYYQHLYQSTVNREPPGYRQVK